MLIKTLIARSFKFGEKKGWHRDNLRERLALLELELARAPRHLDVYYDDSGRPCGLPAAIASVFIGCADICGTYGINVTSIIGLILAHETTP